MSERLKIRMTLAGILVLLGSLIGGSAATSKADSPTPLYGRCHARGCSCFAFSGTRYTCNRGGCAHHYDLHY